MIAKLWQFIIKNKHFPLPCLTPSLYSCPTSLCSLLFSYSLLWYDLLSVSSYLTISTILFLPPASLALMMPILLAMFSFLPLLSLLDSCRWCCIFSLSLQQQKLWFNRAMMSTVLYCAPLHTLMIAILFLFWNEALKHRGTQERVSTLFSVNKNIFSNFVITFQTSCLFSCSLEELILLILPAYNL